MRKRLPPLNALRTFEAAARNGSFKAAADELCVSHSAISHQIKQLERYLGVELFLRKSRRVELTAVGAGYYPLIRTAFDEIIEGTDQILAPEAPGILSVQVYSTFAIRWLIPRLRRFHTAHPDVQVRLHTSQDDVDFQQEDVDVCVMIGTRSDADVHYDFLFSARMFPVCSPALLEGGPFEHVSDLSQHTILQVYPSAEDWHVWLAENDVQGVDPDSGLQLDSYELAMHTAVQGVGVALGMEPFVDAELDAGLLVEPFPNRRVYPRGDYYLACREQRSNNKRIKAFRSWLLAEMSNDDQIPKLRRKSEGAYSG